MATFDFSSIKHRSLLYAFAACIVPIHLWSIFNLLKEVPAWILRLTTWDLIGVIAYTQVFAFFESLIIFMVLYLLGSILPFHWDGNKFSAQSAMAVFVTAAWFIFAHMNDQVIRSWGVKEFLPWVLLYSLSVVMSFSVVQRIRAVEDLILTMVERITVLALTYLFIDFVSVFVVVIRNV